MYTIGRGLWTMKYSMEKIFDGNGEKSSHGEETRFISIVNMA